MKQVQSDNQTHWKPDSFIGMYYNVVPEECRKQVQNDRKSVGGE